MWSRKGPTVCLGWDCNVVKTKLKHARPKQLAATHHMVLLEGGSAHQAVLCFVMELYLY